MPIKMQKYQVIKLPCKVDGQDLRIGETFTRSTKDALVTAFLRFGQIEAVGEPTEVDSHGQARPTQEEHGVRAELMRYSRPDLLKALAGLRARGLVVKTNATAPQADIVDAMLEAAGYRTGKVSTEAREVFGLPPQTAEEIAQQGRAPGASVASTEDQRPLPGITKESDLVSAHEDTNKDLPTEVRREEGKDQPGTPIDMSRMTGGASKSKPDENKDLPTEVEKEEEAEDAKPGKAKGDHGHGKSKGK